MNRNFNIILIILIIMIPFYYILIKLKPVMAFKLALKEVLNKYGRSIAEHVEAIYRLETNHFKSGQFKGTFSPGMEKFADTYPYGWNTIHKVVWSKHPEYRPIGFKPFTEGKTGIKKYFLVFPSIRSAVMTLAGFLEYYDNNPGRWFSTDPVKQANYNRTINLIKPVFTNEIA